MFLQQKKVRLILQDVKPKCARINQSGLYLADTVAENIAIGSDVPKNSLIIQNASDTLAYFSDTGNLTLRGALTQSYAAP